MDAIEERAKKAKVRVGAVLKDKWTLDALLGVGGMASVYAATHRNNGKRVAVKMLHPELSVVPQIKTRFLREGYAANKVNHPGVVSVLDDDTSEDGSVYLVMELLEGENLEQRRVNAGGKLDLAEVLWITDQLLDVLVAAHAMGIIHRDIKPENIFLTSQAVLKILDFGLARVQPTAAPAASNSSGLTRTNMLMGTLDFMAPEQARGKWDGVGVQADLWSVGASIFMLLTGHPVHEENTLESQIKAASSRPARSIRTLRPDLPAPVVALIDRALAYDPRERWTDALSMQEAVRDAYTRLGGERSTTTRPPAVEPAAAHHADSDLARTQALSKIAFDDDDVTRDLNHLAQMPELIATSAFQKARSQPPPAPAVSPSAPAPPPPAVAAPPPPTPSTPVASPPPPREASRPSAEVTSSPPPPPPREPSRPELAQTPTTPLAVPEAPAAEAASPATPAPEAATAAAAEAAEAAAQAPEPFHRRHRRPLVIGVPAALVLLAALIAARSCGEAPPQVSPAPPASSASLPVASSAPSIEAPPPPPDPPASASASSKKPSKPPPGRPPIRKKK